MTIDNEIACCLVGACRAGPKEGGERRVRGQTNSEAWEDWGQVDPLWSILTEPSRRESGWDLDTFFSTGDQAIESVFDTAAPFGVPRERRRALDFGCGVGRLTRALAARVPETVGLDIASSMVNQARELNRAASSATFEVHAGEDLSRFPAGTFDVVVSLYVLQHIPDLALIERYVQEFVRVLAEGGLAVFQLPYAKPAVAPPTTWRARLALRRRVTLALRRLGVPAQLLYRRLGWQPDMPMTPIAQERVQELVAQAGGTVLLTTTDTDFGGVRNAYYYVST